jgi:hypothetical protein
MTVQKLDRLSWGRSGRPVAKSERQTLLKVLRQARQAGRVRESETEKDDPKGRPPP